MYIDSTPVKSLPGGNLPNGYPTLFDIESAIKSGLRGALNRGPLARCPLFNLEVKVNKVILYTPDSSSKGLLRMTSFQSLQKCLKEKIDSSVLYEPVMNVLLRVPEKYTGQVGKDITGNRRGHILKIQSTDESQTGQHRLCEIQAQIPLSEMMGYAVQLRSMTAGNTDFTMDLAGFGQMQKDRQSKILIELRGY